MEAIYSILQYTGTRGYILTSSTSKKELANTLKDWAFNMRKIDGSDYKEVVKAMWNISAKLYNPPPQLTYVL